ncbi:hypothetical protein TRIUR3_05609 [Triticum urartu]|uniref:Uncharacterized protein n=1 Tax=Triticum urartu TaxID=4572 RepID=M7Z700_TRIUA|nr:hypothetical protein TRIUR3_05609 [Triticum urartu]
MAPDPPLAADLPEPCREALFEYAEQHRGVLAAGAEPRVSIACFFSTHFHPASTRAYGPIGELVSGGSPALYRETLVRDYVKHYYAIGLDGKAALSVFRL